MKLARYVGGGKIAIEIVREPELPTGGLLVKAEACGLCSGELMAWYMDRKVPHVLGHEVAGKVVESGDSRFPVGSRVFAHHHAPCMKCAACLRGAYVHCPQWRATRLDPGGMAEFFAVSPENLTDTHVLGDLRPQEAALIEPLACVLKSLSRAGSFSSVAVVGLGSMGLMHLLAAPGRAVGYDLNGARISWAKELGLDARPTSASARAETVVVCPGSASAFDLGLRIVEPGGRIVLFAPFSPNERLDVPWERVYFDEIELIPSYSCGPEDVSRAIAMLRQGRICAEQVVSHFVSLDELPAAYEAMKVGDILKAMVLF